MSDGCGALVKTDFVLVSGEAVVELHRERAEIFYSVR